MVLRLDDTGFGDLKIYQDPDEFCYGIDAVLLADFAAKGINEKKSRNKRAVDLGAGTGIVSIIMSHKTDVEYMAAIELQKHSFSIGEKNISFNKLENTIHIFNEDIRSLVERKGEGSPFADMIGSFDVVTTNPPYTVNNGGIHGANKAKSIARHETTADLNDFIKLGALLLRDKGSFYMVHRPSRLIDICEHCRENQLEPKTMRFVSGKPGDIPNILLVHCVKNGRRELRLLPPLSVYKLDGSYNNEIMKIYEKEENDKK